MRLFHRHGPDEPCPHMKALLNRQADGTIGRFGRLYALAHVARCGPCRDFLRRLEQMLSELSSTKQELSGEVRDRLMSRLRR